MRRYSGFLKIAALFLFLSGMTYFVHYLIFRDAHHIFIYMVGDLAFLPLEVFLVVIVYETMTAILTFDTIYVMTGGGPANSTALISWFAYAEIFKSLNLGNGIALAIIIALITLVLIILYLRVLRTEETAVSS